MMSDAPVLNWVEVASCDDIWSGEMLDVDADGQKVPLVNCPGGIRAYQNRCPHQRMALSKGKFDGQVITCCAHLWQFDAATGKGINPQSSQLLSYAVKVLDNLIYIGLPRQIKGKSLCQLNSLVLSYVTTRSLRH